MAAKNPLTAHVIKMTSQGVPPQVIAETLGLSRAKVSALVAYARRAGRLPPRATVPLDTSRRLTNYMRATGLAGMGSLGSIATEIPTDVQSWLLHQCTSEKTLADVVREILLASYDVR